LPFRLADGAGLLAASAPPELHDWVHHEQMVLDGIAKHDR
jgi:hypothetical protein